MEKSMGALWIKTGKKGEYWTGNIELPDGTKQNVIVFRNIFKENNQPDLRIYKQKSVEDDFNLDPKEDFTITDDTDLPF